MRKFLMAALVAIGAMSPILGCHGTKSNQAQSDRPAPPVSPFAAEEHEFAAGPGGGSGPSPGFTSQFSDSAFRVFDNADTTKKAAFEVSGITTGTTRTFTFPDVSGTLAIPAGASPDYQYYNGTGLAAGTLKEAASGRVGIGGTTAAFPSLKRNAAALNLRLADDSADAALTCAGITASGAIAAAATATLDVGATGARFRSLYLGGNTPAASLPFFDAAQTWNDAGVAFTGIKCVFTTTASTAGSNLLDLKSGTSGAEATVFSVRKDGFLYASSGMQVSSTASIYFDTRGSIASPSDGVLKLLDNAGTSFSRLQFGGTTSAFPSIKRNAAALNLRLADDSADAALTCAGITASGLILASAGTIRCANSDGDISLSGSILFIPSGTAFGISTDCLLTRKAAATWHLGDDDALAPVAQTLGVQGSRGGTDVDVAGATFTVRSGIGTGAALASSIIFQTPTVGASSSTSQTMATRLTVATADIRSTVPVIAPYFQGSTTNPAHMRLDMASNVTHATFIYNGSAVWDVGSSGTVTLNGESGQIYRPNSITRTTSLPILDLAQGWNDGAVTFVGAKIVITDTASAAGSLPFQILGGAAGATNLMSVSRLGLVTAANFASDGQVSAATDLLAGPARYIYWSARSFMQSPADGQIMLSDAARTDFSRLQFGGTTSAFPALGRSGTSLVVQLADGTLQCLVTPKAAARLHLGAADAAAPVAQTLGVQGARSGTDTDTAGASFTTSSGIGTGTGAASSLIWATPTIVASGTGAQSQVTRLTLNSTGFTFADGVCDIIFGSTTGTKIGTATTQKLAFYNSTPIVQGAAVGDASGGAVIDVEARGALNTLLARMRAYGLIAP